MNTISKLAINHLKALKRSGHSLLYMAQQSEIHIATITKALNGKINLLRFETAEKLLKIKPGGV